MSAAKCRGSSRWRPRASFAAVTARAFRARQLLARAKGRRSFLLERGPSRLQRRAASCGPPLFSERPLKLAVDDLHVVDVVQPAPRQWRAHLSGPSTVSFTFTLQHGVAEVMTSPRFTRCSECGDALRDRWRDRAANAHS